MFQYFENTSPFLHVFLNLIFIPESLFGIELLGLGAKGAVISTLISGLIMFVSYKKVAKKKLKIRFDFEIVKPILSAISMLSLLYVVHFYIGTSNILLDINKF